MKNPRRQDLRTTIDREAWKSFQDMICEISTSGRGEYLMTEFLRFGRAFTQKPLMTFETTAWGGESSGGEIRAWGYPTAAPKGCVEPVVSGDVLGASAGVEEQLSVWGGGPNGNELPTIKVYSGTGGDGYYDGVHLWWPSDASIASTWQSGRMIVQSGTPTSRVATVSDTAGISGKGIATNWTPGSGVAPAELLFSSFYLCNPGNSVPWKTAVVAPGDSITFGCSARCAENYQSGLIDMVMSIEYADVDGDFLGYSTSYMDAVTDSWVAYQHAVTVPANAAYATFWIDWSVGAGSGSDMLFNLDQFVCDVATSLTPTDLSAASPAPFGTFHSKTPDGSFEHQANDLEIPYWTDALSWNQAVWDVYYERDYSYMWMQSPSPPGQGWQITSEDHNVGYQSQFSAKCVIGDTGATPWLSPTWEQIWGIENTYLPSGVTITNTVDMNGWNWASYDLPGTQVDPKYIDVPLGYVYWTVTNPPLSGQWIRVHMKADGPCTLQILFVAWDHVHGSVENGGMVAQEEMQEYQYAGSGWQAHEFHFADTLWRTVNPNVNTWQADNRYATIFFRVVGTAGTTVYVDDILQSADFSMDACLAEVTVGVAEWELDSKGLYTGAKLWFKTGGPCGGAPGSGVIELLPPPVSF
jgi:hypothetical protein